jgi:hypothetical protein
MLNREFYIVYRERHMSISDDLTRLAELRQKGHLSEEEFAQAKRQLLQQGGLPPDADNRGEGIFPSEFGLQDEGKTYYSSRWTPGNMLFPDAISLVGDGIVFRKGSLFGSREEHISYRAVASFRLTNGILFSAICIETSGGSQPIVVNGLWKSDAREIQDAFRGLQRKSQY